MGTSSLQTARASTARRQQFTTGAIGLVDSGVRLGARARIGISNRDLAESHSSHHPRLLPFLPIRIEESVSRVMFVGVAVRPTIHGDGLDVPRRIETRAAQHPSQLIADVALEFRKRRLHQFVTPRAVLFARGQTRFAGSTEHEKDHGFFRLAWKVVLAETDGKIEHGITVITTRRNDMACSQLVEGSPIPNRHVRIDQRLLNEKSERFLLLLRKLGAQIRNHGVVASQDTALPSHGLEPATADVAHFYFLR